MQETVHYSIDIPIKLHDILGNAVLSITFSNLSFNSIPISKDQCV